VAVNRSLLENYAEKIRKIARTHGAVGVRVFGSHAKGVGREASDLDLLVDLEDGRDLLDLVGIKQDLESLLCRKVDVLTEEALSPYLREKIVQEAIPL
jgi:predicted nucleotidyltransferase